MKYHLVTVKIEEEGITADIKIHLWSDDTHYGTACNTDAPIRSIHIDDVTCVKCRKKFVRQGL